MGTRFPAKLCSALHIGISVSICLLGVFESLYGMCQLFSICPVKNAVFPMTGHFNNPGPYGGYISVAVAIAASLYIKARESDEKYLSNFLKIVSFTTVFCGLIVLPATMSRMAWLALLVSLTVLGFRELELGERIRKHKFMSAVLTALLAMFLVLAFFAKKDSAIGRFHIWNMEFRAMLEKPLTGHGRGTVLGAYGRAQAEYFAEKQRSAIIERVAGCPEYAFNEYLRIGVEYGVVALFFFVAVLSALLYVLLKNRSPLAYGLIAFCIFAFFSYPLEAIHFKSDSERRWENLKSMSNLGLYEEVVCGLEPLYDELSDNFRYLYDYGYSLFRTGHYVESISVLRKGTEISSDPMFHNILGRNFEALEMYDIAEKEYFFAHNMVPQRLYPLILIMRMHLSLGNEEMAMHYAKKVLGKPFNPEHRAMLELRSEAQKCAETLSVKFLPTRIQDTDPQLAIGNFYEVLFQ